MSSHSFAKKGALALVLASASHVGLAHAQAGAAPDASVPSGGLDEIIVSAERREESLQKVGITVAAFDGDDLAAIGVTTAEDLATHIPNVNVNFGIGISSFNIRGVGLSSFAANLDSPIGIHVDEVYQSKPFMLGLLMFDIDRTEVSSGPQGTLFGRNTTGGAVNFTTHKPDFQLGAGTSLTYANYETLRGEGFVNVPLSDTLAMRVSGMGVHQGKGYYRNLTLGSREGYERNYAFRGQLRWRSGDTDVLLSGHYGRQQGTLPPYEGVGAYTPESYSAFNPGGGFTNVGLLTFCDAYLNGTVTGGDTSCVRGNDGKTPGDDDPYTSTGHHKHPINNRSTGGMLRIDQDLGFATVTSITDFEDFRRDQSEVGDGSPTYDGVWLFWYSRLKQFTQELRLTSNGSGPWDYVIGAFYEHDSLKTRDYLSLGAGSMPTLAGFYTDTDQTTNAYAVYTNHKIALTSSLDLIAGMRFNHETYDITGGTCFGSGLTGAVIQRPSSSTCVPLAESTALDGGPRIKDTNTSFKFGAQWNPYLGGPFNAVMLYGSVATGYRSAGYNSDLTTDQDSFTKLRPEQITAYEIGFKSQSFGNTLRVNGSLFHYNFENGIIRVDQETLVPVTVNAAKIRTWGAELSTVWQPVDGMQLSAAGGWLDAKIVSDLTSAGVSIQGNRPVNSPKYTFNGDISYDIPAGDYDVKLNLNANWRAAQFLETSNKPAIKESPYWLVNAAVSVGPQDGPWSVSLWGKNLTKTVYRTYTNDLYNFGWLLNLYAPPRTYGATVNLRF